MKGPEKRGVVYAALSGGVDSAVAALRLIDQGYDVTGVFMKPWQPKGMRCLWQQEREDALRIAAHIGIPFKTWDFSGEYHRHVTEPMVAAYRAGRTPNPDIECNRHIKFGLFYRHALKCGARWVATGHYARIGRKRGTYSLRMSADAEKDQTYFLWKLRSSQLPRILFPVGDLRKAQVRTLAKRAGIHVAGKKDSQGVCFIGPIDMKTFLTSKIRPKRGVIMHSDGRIIGHHDGAGYYTIGQRHGLNIRDGGGPYFIVAKDMRRNTVTVGTEDSLYMREARISRMHWIGPAPGRTTRLTARIRHRGERIPAHLTGSVVRFGKPVRAIAPGQSVVFYEGTTVLGGAVFR